MESKLSQNKEPLSFIFIFIIVNKRPLIVDKWTMNIYDFRFLTCRNWYKYISTHFFNMKVNVPKQRNLTRENNWMIEMKEKTI